MTALPLPDPTVVPKAPFRIHSTAVATPDSLEAALHPQAILICLLMTDLTDHALALQPPSDADHEALDQPISATDHHRRRIGLAEIGHLRVHGLHEGRMEEETTAQAHRYGQECGLDPLTDGLTFETLELGLLLV